MAAAGEPEGAGAGELLPAEDVEAGSELAPLASRGSVPVWAWKAVHVCPAAAALLVLATLAFLGLASLWASGPPAASGSSAADRPRQLSELCNASAPILRPRTPARTFRLPAYWSEACQDEVDPVPTEFGLPIWKGQNRCWRWLKKVGCYETLGTLSWFEGQLRAAKLGYMPYPEIVPFNPISNPDLCERYGLGAALPPPAESEAQALQQAAAAWVNSHIAVYVINLSKDVDRWRAMATALVRLGITFKRIQGVDLREPDALSVARSEGLIPESYDVAKAQATARMPEQAMNGLTGTVGCAAAHLRAMRQVVEQADARPLALILEDDVQLADDFPLKVRRLLAEEAPCDWNAISLKSKCPHGECVSPHLTRVLPDGNEPQFRCRHGVNYGFFAMLYRISTLDDLRSRLAFTVWDENRPHCLDVDVALASIADEIAYYAVPSMQTPGFLSEGALGSSRYELNLAADQAPAAPQPAQPVQLPQVAAAVDPLQAGESATGEAPDTLQHFGSYERGTLWSIASSGLMSMASAAIASVGQVKAGLVSR